MKSFVLLSGLLALCSIALCQNSSIIVGSHNGEWGANGGVIFSLQTDGKNFKKLKEYNYNPEGGPATTAVVQASNGFIYGTTAGGGKHLRGVIYINKGGNDYSVLKSFTAEEGWPRSNLVEIEGQKFVGVIQRDITSRTSEIYRVNIDGTGFEKVGNYPLVYNSPQLLKTPVGIFGAAGPTLFKLGNDGTGFSIVKEFPTTSEQFQEDLYYPGDGYIYGLTYHYSIFRIKPDGTSYQVLRSFTGEQQPPGQIAFIDGKIYGGFYQGIVFKMNMDGSNYEVIQNGGLPVQLGVNSTSDGKLIVLRGMTDDMAEIVKMDINGQSPTVIGTVRSGYVPFARIVRTTHGYYATCQDGPKYGGLIFKFQDTGNVEIIKEFTSPGGLEPQGDVVVGDDGYLYGITQWGGDEGRGTFYRMSTDGSDYKVLKSFDNDTGGNGLSLNYSGPMLASDGFLYGIHSYSNIFGSLYKLSRDGSQYTEIYQFNATNQRPTGSLIEVDGKLVGTYFGEDYKGSLFSINKDGTLFSYVYDFPEHLTFGKLIKGLDGKLYGTCRTGSETKGKFFFRINGDGTGFTKIHDIETTERIEMPRLLYHSDGNLYGQGYLSDNGAQVIGIFKLAADGSSYKIIYKFTDNADGSPTGSMSEGPDGYLYGRWKVLSQDGPTKWIFFKVKTDGSGYQKIYEDVTQPYNNSLSDLVFVPVAKILPSINYTSSSTVVKGTSIDLAATSNSTGAISWSVTNMTGSATLSGNKLNAVNEGTVKLKINVAGDDYFTAGSTEVVLRIKNAAMDLKKPAIWGSTVSGGAFNGGTLFSMNLDGSGFSTNYDFRIDGGGAMPESSFLTNVNGLLYGTTTFGGAFDRGVIFSFNPATNAYTVEYSFKVNEAADVKGGLIAHSNGRLFGLSATGGQGGFGTLFSFDPTSKTCVIHHHFRDDDAYPRGNVVEAPGGAVYGITQQDNIFKYDPAANTFTHVKTLTALEGVASNGKMYLASDNKIYTTAAKFGSLHGGTVIRIDPVTGDVTSIHDFDPQVSSSEPIGGLIEVDGKLYGTTTVRGTNNEPKGSIFSITLATSAFAELYVFGEADGHFVTGSLAKATNGKLYGTTRSGGQFGRGTIFEFNPANNNFKKVADLNNLVGTMGTSTPIAMADGKVYGLCKTGGISDAGTIFSYDPTTGTTKSLHEFVWRTGGANPIGNLAIKDKTIYGAAVADNYNNGSIFRYDIASGVYSEVTQISKSPKTPGMISVDIGGNSLIGAYSSPVPGGSVLYNYNLDSKSVLIDHVFTETEGGLGPRDHLVKVPGGSYYGVTSGGGQGYGVIYEYQPSTGIYSVKYSLKLDADGSSPTGLLLKGDVFYGTTQYGGSNGSGTVYSYNYKENEFAKLADFSATVGAQPIGAMVEGPNGKLYGLTLLNASSQGFGALFEFDPATKQLSKKYQFAVATGLPSISGSLIFGEGGKIYGALREVAETNGNGGIFEFDLNKNEFRVVTQFDGANGSNPPGYFAVMRGEQTIEFPAPTGLTVGAAPVTMNATASSGLSPTYSSTSDKVSITGTTIKGLKAGKVEVTASQDGGLLYTAASKAATFCVNPAKPIITASDPDTDHTSLKSNSSPTGNQWYRNGEAISGATAVSYEPFLEGVYTLKITVEGCSSEESNSINIKVTGLEDPSSYIAVTPNPADDKVDMMIADPDDKPITITLTDVLGRISEQRDSRTNSTERFDIQSLAKGFYIFKVTNNGVTVSKKFVKR
ncbi:MAG TPA: choice-of-anchor tandem repeat GloVer-containing protein [Cyclobacteriaceae bacterium]|nr:choice-of-anchor tandem repeat GloVer-containing protein [Cyclobacteriaceae bacterium]